MRLPRVKWSHRPKDALWGRFGGGWNWKLGFQIGSTTLIVSLLVAELRFDFSQPRKP